MEFRQVFDSVFRFEMIVAGVVAVLVAAAFLAALMLSRRRSPDRRRRDSHPLVEGGYALLLAAVAGVIAYVSLSSHEQVQNTTSGSTSTPPAAQVDVRAFQWCWQFDYAAAGKSVTGVCREHHGQLPTMVVPAGQPVQLNLTSGDVVHALWIPDLGVKLDAMPDHTNSVTLTFEEGRWLGRCSEFCGPFHPSMHFYVRAVPPEQYQQWLAQGTAA